MADWEGFGERLRDQIKRRGFINRKGEADIQRFALKYGYLPTYVYRWAGNKTVPNRMNLFKLATDLDCDPAWLLLGDYKKLRGALKSLLLPLVFALGCSLWPSAQGAAHALPVGGFSPQITGIQLIGSWRRYWWRLAAHCAQGCTLFKPAPAPVW